MATSGDVIHEMLHVLGLYHEQSRHDRDNYITVNDQLISSLGDYWAAQWAKRQSPAVELWPYGYHSIMHYPALSPEGLQLVSRIASGKSPFPGDHDGAFMLKLLGQKVDISLSDIVNVLRLYGCPKSEVCL